MASTARRLFKHCMEFDLIADLMALDVGRVYLYISKVVDPDSSKFGLLPLLASCGEGEIGALNAESYAERVISAVNLIMPNGRTLLGDEDFDMLVTLRMNREFMIFMRGNYFTEIKALQPFNITVVKNSDDEVAAAAESEATSKA